MRPEQTIKLMISQFPSIFPNRWKCIYHLFYTLGNGYEWIGGELIESGDFTKDIGNISEALECYFIRWHSEESRFLEYPIRYCIRSMEKDVMTVVKFFEEGKSIKDTYSPGDLIEYSGGLKIFNVPKDITSEWKQFCQEAIDIVLENSDNYSAELITKLKEIKL